MEPVRIKSFAMALALMGFMVPAQAFNISAWFSSLSSRSKGTLCVAAAAACAGVGYLGYKIWAKSANKQKLQKQEAARAIKPEAPAPAPLLPQPEIRPMSPALRLDSDDDDSDNSDDEIDTKVAFEASNEWISEAFKIPEQPTCVAVGKNKHGTTIILVGGVTGYIYSINTTTNVVTQLQFPRLIITDLRRGDKEFIMAINSIKMLPHDKFAAQSSSFVCLYTMEGDLLAQTQPTFRSRLYNGVDVGTDKYGKPIICIDKDDGLSFFDPTCSKGKLGDIDTIELSSSKYANSACCIAQDAQRNLKIFKLHEDQIVLIDATTGEVESHIDNPTPANKLLGSNNGYIITFGKNARFVIHTQDKKMTIPPAYPLFSAALGRDGRWIGSDYGGSIHVWDFDSHDESCTRTKIHQFKTVQKLSLASLIAREDLYNFPTFQCVALNTRSLGNAQFVSAAKDGTVKLWTNIKEFQRESADAEKAAKMYGDFKNDNGDGALSTIILEYVGSDADQACAEIVMQKKKEQEEKEAAADKAWAEILREKNQ